MIIGVQLDNINVNVGEAYVRGRDKGISVGVEFILRCICFGTIVLSRANGGRTDNRRSICVRIQMTRAIIPFENAS